MFQIVSSLGKQDLLFCDFGEDESNIEDGVEYNKVTFHLLKIKIQLYLPFCVVHI